MRIVICDDHELLVEALSVALTDRGHDVVGSTTTLSNLVDLLAATLPDVCLLDLGLPLGDPLDLLPSIRTAAPDTAVVILSASVEEGIVLRALSAGAAGFVPKARPVSALCDALDVVAMGQLALEPGLLASALRPAPPVEDPMWLLGFLTGREWQVLRCLADGMSNREIAATLGVSPGTSRTHVQHVLAKLGVTSRLKAAAFVARHGEGVPWPPHVSPSSVARLR